ncbi:MAG TPA: EthD family reductase [Baekduia sp.]|uniref:EthD family reductase n=1 Tax=Baekduia sp. TaxID=2600305 RepID=UPI002D782080|nr:EthD family reductase [Baekduia sp.]HET6509084.1 EthD family reductase [Baekduia sp.]
MIKLVVGYHAPDDAVAFEAHYAGTHVGLAEAIPGLRRFEWGRVLGTPDGSVPPYAYLAELCFDDETAMNAALTSPEGSAAGADVANFASGGATLMVAEVRE